VIVLATVFFGASLSACTHTAARPQLLALRCSDSAGQQGQDHETVVGGVEGLVLPGSDDPAGLVPIRASDGTRYYIYKPSAQAATVRVPIGPGRC